MQQRKTGHGPPLAGSADWLESHGINPKVWEARGSWRYGSKDIDKVMTEIAPHIRPKTGLSPNTGRPIDPQKSLSGRLQKIEGVLVQSGGLVMPKHPPEGYAPIAPQLRPDLKGGVVTGTYYHLHDPREDGWWPTVPSGRNLPPGNILNDSTRHRHIGKQGNEQYDPATGEGEHNGIDVSGVHMHVERAKYYFLPGTDQARIDLHPMAADLLPQADLVYFVLEGALKNDAVLSSIIENGTRESVFSVPSVTLWDQLELAVFAGEHLVGKAVIIIPDADWYTNDRVVEQALYARTALREVLGPDVWIGAPPVDFPRHTSPQNKGVDDWLGTPGVKWALGAGVVPGLDGLELLHREAPRAVEEWEPDEWWTKGIPNVQRLRRAQRALIRLSLLGDTHERNLGSMKAVLALAKKVDVPVTLRDLSGTYDLLEGSLTPRPYTYKVPKKRNGRWVTERTPPVWEWKKGEEPVIQLKPEFRATPVETPLLLRDLRNQVLDHDRRLEEVERRLNALDGGLQRPDLKLVKNP